VSRLLGLDLDVDPREDAMVFVGLDWAETHHDVVVMDQDGRVAARRRVPEGWPG
jgi:hypothetical protein